MREQNKNKKCVQHSKLKDICTIPNIFIILFIFVLPLYKMYDHDWRIKILKCIHKGGISDPVTFFFLQGSTKDVADTSRKSTVHILWDKVCDSSLYNYHTHYEELHTRWSIYGIILETLVMSCEMYKDRQVKCVGWGSWALSMTTWT